MQHAQPDAQTCNVLIPDTLSGRDPCGIGSKVTPVLKEICGALLILTLGCAPRSPPSAPAAAPWSRSLSATATRSVVHSRHGMVAASHPLAVQIGVDILRRGGNAIDAAIAVNAALGVMEPMMCGIGGDMFALLWDAKTGKLHGLNGSGHAPAALTADKVKPDEKGEIPLSSPFSWTVPGAVDGWFELHRRFGKIPMKELLAPAIAAAREGVPVPRVIAAEWRPTGQAGYAATFLPAPSEGSIFRNPDLARSYEAIAEGGRNAYYQGPLTEVLLAFSGKQGGFFAKADFAAQHAEWVEPISTDYRGVTVWQMPPNGSGLAVLQMLNILETFDLRAMGRESADFWHVMVEAKKLVFEDRARYYGDSTTAQVPVSKLLSKDYARVRARLIDREHAARSISPGTELGDTTYIAVADEEGNMVSLIQSNFKTCGSGYVPDGLGFCLHNRGAQFSLKPGTPNFLQPGKRPMHTIIPAFATKDGKPWLAFGVMGGDFQPQGQVQVLVNLIDFGMDLQQAGDAARYRHMGSTEPTGHMVSMSDGGTVFLEAAVAPAIRAELQRRGHNLSSGPTAYGGYEAVARDPLTGVLSGATESRKDGCAQGY